MITLATKVTILRILLVPVCLSQLVYYAVGYGDGVAKEWHRLMAFWVFVVASLSDAVDGFIARQFNQQSQLGRVLDPIADKMLLMTVIILLAVNPGNAFPKLPLWFPILVVSRDVLLMAGALLIHIIIGEVKVKPRIVSKIATLFQMVTLGCVMLKMDPAAIAWPLYAAAFFTSVSLVWYLFDGAKQFNSVVNLKV
ncbi:MAG: CDP-alcohol phosphatidyltransferase family protein [Verrucomicrobia bacterium]|jgi:CDP-diacylglycerol--glycerol-3-phosphate 3-phosphatidyltransferase|nr:CDP-alcohol phosphatidyltransferase family protein [Verrucomicrobiota bacterium]